MRVRQSLLFLALLLVAGCGGHPSVGGPLPFLPSSDPITQSVSTAKATPAAQQQNTNTPAPPLLTALAGDTYHITSFIPGFDIDVENQSISDGAQLINYPLNGGLNQVWRFVLISGSTYYIQNPISEKCMDVAGASIDGANVVLGSCGSPSSQSWQAIPDANNTILLRNAGSNLCLGVEGDNINWAATLVQTACTDDVGQRWTLSPKTYITPGRWANVQYVTDLNNSIVSASFTMVVPAQSTATGTVFVSGQTTPVFPNNASFSPVNEGYFGPLLSWGPDSCGQEQFPAAYSTWWAGGYYLNDDPNSTLTGCYQNGGMSVDAGDPLNVVMAVQGTTWHQTITNTNNGQSVSYDTDLGGQAQTDLVFKALVLSSAALTQDILFENIEITVAQPDKTFCSPTWIGADDNLSIGVLSPDARTCTIANVTLRAQNVPATTPVHQ